MKNSILVIALLLLCTLHGNAFQGNEKTIWSQSMKKEVPIYVITPDEYSPTKKYPVVYMLHGHNGNHMGWAQNDVIGHLADQYGMIIVMPDGGKDSWYFDSPMKKEYRYETFITNELISYVDSCYSTVADRGARAITGFSMGGHGAFYIGMKHQDKFANIGSFAGGVDFRPFPQKWGIASHLGTIEQHPKHWEKYTVINMTHLLKPGNVNIVFECGVNDFFYKVNCDMHDKLLKEGIQHDFYIRPGVHSWAYCLKNAKYQFMYFNDKFTEYLNR